jgi:hypothetical protein
MANTDVLGMLKATDGSTVAMKNLAMTESATGLASTAVELQTDASYTVSAQSLGTYWQDKTLDAASIVCETSGSNAYIDRQGLPLCFLSICTADVAFNGLIPTKKVKLQAGDKLMVCNAAAATRTLSLAVRCSDGTERCFVGTTGGGDTTSLVDTVTGNSIGDTLQKKVIKSMMCQSVDGHLITSGGGPVILNAQGAIVGGIVAANQTAVQPQWTPVNIPIDLNFVAQYITSA